MALPYSNQVGQILPPPTTYGYMLESQNRATRKIPKKIHQTATLFSRYHLFCDQLSPKLTPFFPTNEFTFMAVDNFFCECEKISMDKIPDLQDSIKILFVKILGSII